jgi:hypothetical protein
MSIIPLLYEIFFHSLLLGCVVGVDALIWSNLEYFNLKQI